MPNTLTIGRLAAAADVHVETIRYYQRRGLLDEPERPFGTVRRYSQADVERLRFIKRTQAVGFTLAEVEPLLRMRHHPSCRATRDLVAEKLAAIEIRIREMQRLRTELRRWIANCDANPADDCCPTLAALDRDSNVEKMASPPVAAKKRAARKRSAGDST